MPIPDGWKLSRGDVSKILKKWGYGDIWPHEEEVFDAAAKKAAVAALEWAADLCEADYAEEGTYDRGVQDGCRDIEREIRAMLAELNEEGGG